MSKSKATKKLEGHKNEIQNLILKFIQDNYSLVKENR